MKPTRDGGGPLPGPMAPRRTVRWALGLSALAPVVIAGLAVVPGVADAAGGRPLWFLALSAAAVAASATGAGLLWKLSSPESVTAVAPLASAEPAGSNLVESPRADSARAEAHGHEEVESLMDSFSRVLTSIEQQSADISQYSVRLDNAYKEIETSSAKLKEFSFKDEVTGLYNRRFFSIRLEEEVSRYRRFNHPASLVLIDLDGFKAINDELGHPAGDETLRGVADILMRHSRGINVICRYGGDEFAVLLVETAKAGAWLYADRIRYVLPSHVFSHGRHITASFGIAALPEDVAPSPDELIKAADEALYAAKRAGKNRVSVHGDSIPTTAAG